jgi:hypothetical protein
VLGSHGNVILVNTTVGNLTGSGLLCTAMVNIPFFWPAVVLLFYIICFFLFGAVMQSMKLFTVTTAIMFVFVTIMAVMGFIGSTMWAGSFALLMFSLIVTYFTNKG